MDSQHQGDLDLSIGSEFSHLFGTQETLSDQTEVQPVQPEEVVEEGKQEEQVKAEAQAEPPSQKPDKSSDRKAEDYHRKVIDLLEEKFKALDQGKLTDEELRAWFDGNKEFGDIANRSKRLKDKYRPLMERDPAGRVNPDIAAQRQEQIRDKGGEIDDDDKPLTMAQFRQLQAEYDQQKEEKMLAKGIADQRKDKLREYAEERKLQDEDYEDFAKITEAIYPTRNWTYDEALAAAYNALRPSKANPTGVQVGSKVAPTTTSKVEIDLEKGYTVSLSDLLKK